MFRFAIAASAVMALLVPFVWAAEEEKPRAKILVPKDGAKVVQFEDLVGTIESGLWPVVVVRPLVAGESWYVQTHPEKVTKDGKFVTRVVFGGRDSTGVKFRVVIICVPGTKEDAAKKFKTGARLKTLPVEFDTSPPITCVRE